MADGYLLTPPKDQPFYNMLGFIMTYIGVGDRRWWGMKPFNKFIATNRLFVVCFTPAVLISQILYLCIHFGDLSFDILGIMFSVIPVTWLVQVITISSRRSSYKKVMEEFMPKIQLYNYKDQSDFVKMKVIETERYTRWTTYYLLIFLMADWVAWIVITGFNNYKNREAIHNNTVELQTVIYLVMPVDYENNLSWWLVVHSCNVYLVWIGCIVVVTFNAINYTFIYNLIGHIHVLRHKIQTVVLEGSDDEVRRKLVDIIEYHSFVVRIFRDIESAFGMNVAANYFYNLIADSLLLYQIMMGDKGNLMAYGLMFVVYVGGLILLSFVLEEIRRQSDDLHALVYNIPWETMSVSNQKMMVLMLARMQAPLMFKAAGGLMAGVRPMLSIMKSTFSYYVMLKSSMKA